MREGTALEELRRRLPSILPEGKIRWIHPRDPGPDGEAEFSIGGHRIRLVFEMVMRPTLAILRDKAGELRLRDETRHGHRVPIIAAPHLNREMQELCRTLGVGFLDLSGNVWIKHGPVVIKKEVAKNLYPHQARERSPFADRASRVLRFLLDKSEPLGVRAIAAEIALDPGYVSRVLRTASAMRYVALDSRGKARARNQEEMLGDWSSFNGWRKNEEQGFFYLGPPEIQLDEEFGKVLRKFGPRSYALTLHSGNNRIQPFANYPSMHLYVAEGSRVIQELEAMFKLRSVHPGGANVIVAKPYYRDSVFFGARQVDGLWVVSDLQLYLDLKRFPVRGVEASEDILERRLRPLWSGSR